MVTKSSNGDIGYLHIRAMDAPSLRQFTLDLARKDTRLIRAALDEVGMAFPTIGPILGLFDEAARRGFGQEDGAAVVKLWMQHGSGHEG